MYTIIAGQHSPSKIVGNSSIRKTKAKFIYRHQIIK